MHHTYFWAEKSPTGLPEAAPVGKGQKRKRDYGYLGSTGIFSTAGDLLRFQKALQTDRILTPSSKALLLGKYGKLKSAMANSTDYFSYGMFQTEGPVNSIWLRGNEQAWGVSVAYWLLQTNLSVIVLSNKELLQNGERSHTYISSEIIKRLLQ
jgi:CubicO group peptidase (beta-lactamase class C family)